MAAIGAAWADNAWDVNSWAVGAWAAATPPPPGTVAETGQMRRHFSGWAGERRR